jgi:hypothetical protein
MNQKTLYGWFNMVVRGYPYNEKTAYLLDQNFNPNRRLLSTLVDQKKEFKFTNRSIIKRIIGS